MEVKGKLIVDDTTESTDYTNGSLTANGGAGIGGNVYTKGNVDIGGTHLSLNHLNDGIANTVNSDIECHDLNGVETVIFRANNSQNAIVFGSWAADGAYQKINFNTGSATTDMSVAIANGFQINAGRRNRDIYMAKRDNKSWTDVAFTVVSSVATISRIDHGFETGESVTISASTATGSLANANYTITRVDENTYTVPTAGADGSGTISTAYNFVLPFESFFFYDSGADTLDINTVVTMPGIPTGATAGGAGAGTNELWVTSGHATLPDGVVMRA